MNKDNRVTGYQTDNLHAVSTGVCPNCPDCMNNWGYDDMDKFNHAVENQDIIDEGSFSWNPCDDCNASLGGNSYVAHGLDENNELVHFRVCLDCLMELNGYIWNDEFEFWDG